MAGLADGLTRYLTAVASGLPASNDSPLASALRSAGASASAGAYARGLSDYANATDEATKQEALSKMASVNPTQTSSFITKQKMFGGSDNGLKGEFGSLLKYRMTLDDNDPTAKMIDLRLGVLGKDPTQFSQYQYAGETGKGQAKLGYEPQLAGQKKLAEKQAEAEIKSEENKTKSINRISDIESLEKFVSDNQQLLRPYSEVSSKLGSWTGGVVGMTDKDREKYGYLERSIANIKNDLIARAKEHGQVGINTVAEIERATAGVEAGDYAKLPGALKALKEAELRVQELEMNDTGSSENVVDFTEYFK